MVKLRRPDRAADQSRELFLERFERQFPFGEVVRKFFRTAECDPIFARPVPDEINAPRGSWYLLVRLAPNLEERFGLTREFLVYCTSVQDLQARAINQVKRLIETVNRPIEGEFACVITDDTQASDKVKDWSLERSEGLLILPLARAELETLMEEENASLVLPRVFGDWLFTRNLYDERVPVTGAQFFGRDEPLHTLLRATKDGRHYGVFGLRKIGKTSVLRELQLRARLTNGLRVAVVDLQASAAAESAAHIAHQIGRQIVEELVSTTELTRTDVRKELGVAERYTDDQGSTTVNKLIEAISHALTEGLLAENSLALVLDEAEILFPTSGEPLPLSSALLRGLRGVTQETGKLSLLLAGVNATPCEGATLEGVDNPFFGLLSPLYLGPLEDEACHEMVRRIGRKMGLRWDGDAIDLLVEETGSHPLLARLAASDVSEAHPERPCRLKRRAVQLALQGFDRRHGAALNEMIDSLRRYYPEELDFLRVVASGDREFSEEWREEYPEALNHLVGYGVLDADWLTINIPVLRRWLAVN